MKNDKKKNAIRFGALAVAILIFGGIFSVWALSTQATAEGQVGYVQPEGISVSAGGSDGDQLLAPSVAGRPGQVNHPFELFNIDASDAVGAEYDAIIYLTNGADLMDDGLRYMTLDIALNNTDTNTNIGTQTLTLENGRVNFTFKPGAIDSFGKVEITGGTYGSYTFSGNIAGPVEFMIDVEGA
ncbi:MAG: hypothetical protein KGY76_08010 [Candidatus Thermoplasmatota archaeon]|nr:hypothetical protein [Candidatus Thermoplasmatota archaeon]